MKKILLFSISLLASFLLLPSLSALTFDNNELYTNDKGVKITLEEYTKLKKMHSDTNIINMTQELFDYEIALEPVQLGSSEKYIKTVSHFNMLGNIDQYQAMEVSKEEFDHPISLMGTCYDDIAVDCWESDYKRVILESWSVGANNATRFIIRNTWKIMPAVRSFDLIGLRYSNFNRVYAYGYQTVETATTCDQVYYDYNGTNTIKQANGIALSQNLIDDNNLTAIQNELYVDGNITANSVSVWAAYEHAQSTVTLAQSAQFNFGGGMGNVFSFLNGMGSHYDNTPGLYFGY